VRDGDDELLVVRCVVASVVKENGEMIGFRFDKK
jgi:hypothetical protein